MSSVATSDPDQLAIATIRTLSLLRRPVELGEPGTPMLRAPAPTLVQRFPGTAAARLAASAGG